MAIVRPQLARCHHLEPPPPRFSSAGLSSGLRPGYTWPSRFLHASATGILTVVAWASPWYSFFEGCGIGRNLNPPNRDKRKGTPIIDLNQ